jgi:hypothetical protein
MKPALALLKSLWFLGIITLVFVGRNLYFPALVILTFLALLAPIARALWSKSDLDERQVQVSHFSSHIAYFTYSALLIFALLHEWSKNRAVPSPLLFSLLIIPLVAKMAVCVYQNYGRVSGVAGFFNLFFRGLLPSPRIDERQCVIGNLSSHIAFYLFLTLTLLVVLFKYLRFGLEADSLWQMLLFVPLVVKLYTSLFDTYGADKGAKAVIYILAGIFFIFVLLSHGLSFGAVMEAAPFLLVVVAAYFISKMPQIAGVVFLVVAVLMLILMRGWMSFEVYTRILMWALIPIPFVISGLALIISPRAKSEPS